MEDTNQFVYHRNYKENYENIKNGKGVIELMDIHKDKIGVVCAAGPSLKYCYGWIKKNRKKCVVFAGGSSNIALRNNGIIPDYLIMLDPFSMAEHKIESKDKWFGNIHPKTQVLAAYSAHPDSFDGKKAMWWITNFETKILDTKEMPRTAVFNVNISVSVNTLYFADFCGCKEIIICGQDCGKREGQEDHAWGNDGYFERNGKYRYIKGWDGKNDIITELTYEELKDWLEYCIPNLRCKKVYNTSKDGAYLQGCKNIPIEEVSI